MPPWVANLIGLALGSVIGAEALYIVFARNDVAAPPAIVVPVAVTPHPGAPEADHLPTLQPVSMPRVAPPDVTRPDDLPKVIYPDPPSPQTHRPGSGLAGTGFFVASDGSLLTAAHVVADCARIRVASRWVQPTDAQPLAADTAEDIALLRATHATPPATLPVGTPAAPGGRLFLLGYPASAGPLVPTETWAVLENPQFQPGPAELTDPRRVIWAAAPAVGHGFSGGPMLDPRNGTVVGIVRGMVDSTRLHAVRAAIPASGMVIGPGSSLLTAMLRHEGAGGVALAVSGDEALDTARRATVHVLCLY